jgi:hypothetical protein
MGLTFWIDQNTFAAGLIERVFEQRGLPFYRISDVKDFAYLIEDLKPRVVVLDQATGLADVEGVQRALATSPVLQRTPVVVLGDWQGLEFLPQRSARLPRQLDPFRVPEELQKLLGEL